MMKKIILVMATVLLPIMAAADCSSDYKIARELFKQGEYAQALGMFKLVQTHCGDYANVKSYIEECNKKIKKGQSTSGAKTQKSDNSQKSSNQKQSIQESGKIQVINAQSNSNVVNDDLQKQLDQLKKDLGLEKEKNKKLETDVAKWQKAHQALQRDSIDEKNAIIKSLNDTIKQRDMEIGKLRAEYEELDSMTNEKSLKKKNKELNTENEKLKKQITDYQQLIRNQSANTSQNTDDDIVVEAMRRSEQQGLLEQQQQGNPNVRY